MTNEPDITDTPVTFGISQVERETGLSKDILRVWERRYGFPKPLRDGNGERQYGGAEVEQLRVMKRLVDAGHRPARLMGKPLPELLTLGGGPAASSAAHGFDELLALLRAHDPAQLEAVLTQRLFRDGLQKFVLETVAPLTTAVGESWVRGELAVHEEHRYTEMIKGILRTAMRNLPRRTGSPRVLLTTLPDELHSLGLLMVETLLATEQVPCIALGTQTPVAEIAAAAKANHADVVALSFSAAFNPRAAQSGIRALREALPGTAQVWIGGGLVPRLSGLPPEIVRMPRLPDVFRALASWRTIRDTGQAQGESSGG